MVLLFGGRWSFLKHHRGITHSILGTVCLALIIPILFYLAGLAVARLRGRRLNLNLGGLLIASAIASATHPLMDWTNNYGIRFLLPWSSRWFYGDLVYIVDPFLWVLFGGATFLLTFRTRIRLIAWTSLASVLTLLILLGSSQLPNAFPILVFWIAALICIFVLFAVKAGQRWGSKIAIASFIVMLAYWSGLAYMHSRALTEAREEASAMATSNGETISRLVAMPTLANPLSWECVFETEKASYRFELNLTNRTSAEGVVRYEKPDGESKALVEKAAEDWRAQVFLGFARFPVVKLADTDCTTMTLVQFADLRYTEPGRSRGTFTLDLPVACPNRDSITRK